MALEVTLKAGARARKADRKSPRMLQSDIQKNWWHRKVPPEVTRERLTPLLKEFGVTRICDVTGLDRLGIPVFQAVRPMGRSLSVSQGKGVDPVSAEVSAVMEACETWHAEVAVPNLRRACPSDFGPGEALALDGFVPPDGAPPTSALGWVKASDAVTGKPIWVPWDMVTMDFTRPPDCANLKSSSNGLAGGNTYDEALSSALHEVIERDCHAWFLSLDSEQTRARRINMRTLPTNRALNGLCDTINDAGMSLELFDISNDLEVPAFVAKLYETGVGRRRIPDFGAGCHLDPIWAAIRAITEAAQSRLTSIAGARDDLRPDRNQREAAGNLGSLISGSGAIRAFPDRDVSTSAPATDVDVLIERLANVGCTKIAVFDLTHPQLGIPVLKVLVPGLGYNQNHQPRIGERLRNG